MKDKKPRPLTMSPLPLDIALRGAMSVPAPSKPNKADATPDRALGAPPTNKSHTPAKRKKG